MYHSMRTIESHTTAVSIAALQMREYTANHLYCKPKDITGTGRVRLVLFVDLVPVRTGSSVGGTVVGHGPQRSSGDSHAAGTSHTDQALTHDADGVAP